MGWQLRCALHAHPDIAISGARRATFAALATLEEFVRGCDAIVHLAGMNRGDEAAIESTNIGLTQQLIAACQAAGARPHVIFSSSTHFLRDTAYGRSKRACSDLLREWSQREGGTFTNLILPQVFGECGRPFYNSVVATFCHQLAGNESPRVIDDVELQLIHAQRVAREILAHLRQPRGGDAPVPGSRITVRVLLDKLTGMAQQYRNHLIPAFVDGLDLELFNTFRACLFPRHYPVTLPLREDARGSLFEAVKSLHGGQCFISTTRPGVTRGNHYHVSKVERFLVLGGDALIRVRKLFSGDAVEYRVCGDVPQYIDMPTLHTHNITNVGGGSLTTLFWSHEIFDPERPDTYGEPV